MRSVVFTGLAAMVMAVFAGGTAVTGGLAASQAGDTFAGLPPDSARLRAVPICEGMEPSISPDGRAVAFIGWGGDVRMYDVAAETERRLCQNSNAHDIAWNPSGSRLAFQGEDSTRVAMQSWIWVVNRDGSGLHKVGG